MKLLRSLWLKMIGGFAAVIAVMLVVVTVTVNDAVERQFDRYLVGSGQILTEMMAPFVTEVYTHDGSWEHPRRTPCDVHHIAKQPHNLPDRGFQCNRHLCI